MNGKLSAKQERFCNEYLIDYNATQAAIRAGYSQKTAPVIGNENLKKPNVQERIRSLSQFQQKKTQITGEMVIAELAKIAFSDVRGLFDDNGNLKSLQCLSDDVAASIASVDIETQEKDVYTKKFKRYDKVRALEILAKRFGVDKPETTPQQESDEERKRKEIAEQMKAMAEQIMASLVGKP